MLNYAFHFFTAASAELPLWSVRCVEEKDECEVAVRRGCSLRLRFLVTPFHLAFVIELGLCACSHTGSTLPWFFFGLELCHLCPAVQLTRSPALPNWLYRMLHGVRRLLALITCLGNEIG